MMGNENAANDTTAEVREENAAACEEIAEAGGESAAVSDDAAIEEPGSFERMGLDKKLLRAIGDMGFDSATPIQEKAIPIELSGRDMIGYPLPDPRTCHSGVRRTAQVRKVYARG